MSIVAADIIAYASANMPEDDTSLNGGAIDALNRIVFTDLAANDSVEALSASAGDTTQTLTVYGRKADGTYSSEVKTLNGTTVISFSTLGTIERVEKVILSATCAGIVTVRRSAGGATISTIPIGEKGFQRLFNKAVADAASPKPYYNKIFLKNTNGSLALLSAVVKQNADPTALVSHALEDAVNDTHTTANRITGPAANITAFDDTDKNVPGTDLASGARIGVWLKLSLATGNAPIKNSYTIEMDGSTT